MEQLKTSVNKYSLPSQFTCEEHYKLSQWVVSFFYRFWILGSILLYGSTGMIVSKCLAQPILNKCQPT
jgi:hypothetical protein